MVSPDLVDESHQEFCHPLMVTQVAQTRTHHLDLVSFAKVLLKDCVKDRLVQKSKV